MTRSDSDPHGDATTPEPPRVLDDFAEAFGMWGVRLVITAIHPRWVDIAVGEVCGYGSSVIACDAEAGLERRLDPVQTPDGRPGAAVLLFGFKPEPLGEAVVKRVGQCLMTCPTTAVFDGLADRRPPAGEASDDAVVLPMGDKLRFFGDGGQRSRVLNGSRYWRIPVMEGEFTVESQATCVKGVAGGNLLLCGVDQLATLHAAERAVEVIAPRADVITPFPGGIVRSGSKVGSRYKALFASTNDAWAPTERGLDAVVSETPPEANCVYEIVINGLSETAVGAAMQAAIDELSDRPVDGLLAIGAGNYGGKLGKFHLRLGALPPATATTATTIRERSPRTGWRLTWREDRVHEAVPIDGRWADPLRLGALDEPALRATPVRIGRTDVALEQLFTVEPMEAGDAARLELINAPPMDGLGARMVGGELLVRGDAGDDLGASMSGGLIRVGGVAGDRLGGPDHGESRGMRGGMILVGGGAGRFAGLRMRRGVIAVAGSCGPGAGEAMIAGTLIIGRGPAHHPGIGMQRGAIILLDATRNAEIGPGFRQAGAFDDGQVPWLRMLRRDLRGRGWFALDGVLSPPGTDLTRATTARFLLYRGDRLADGRGAGKGEIWLASPATAASPA